MKDLPTPSQWTKEILRNGHMKIRVRLLDVVHARIALTDQQVKDKEDQKDAPVYFAGGSENLRRAQHGLFSFFRSLKKAEHLAGLLVASFDPRHDDGSEITAIE